MIIYGPRHDSPIHRLDGRVRVLVALAAAVAILVIDRPLVLGAALAAAGGLCGLARLRVGEVLRRLRELNVLMLLLALTLPLSIPGDPAARLGPLSWSEPGLLRVGLIALRANAIMVLLTALVGTMEPAGLALTLRRLGCPGKLAGVLLFMVRYVEVIHHEYHRLRNAMRLRAFRAGCDRRTFRALGYLVGMLMVRSLDRSERIVRAMKCRGWTGRMHVLREPGRLGAPEAAFTAAATLVLAGLLWVGVS